MKGELLYRSWGKQVEVFKFFTAVDVYDRRLVKLLYSFDLDTVSGRELHIDIVK